MTYAGEKLEKETINKHWNKVFNLCMRLGCTKVSVIKPTKEGRLHININPVGNKTEVKIHHDIFLRSTHRGHYHKSNDIEVSSFMNELKQIERSV